MISDHAGAISDVVARVRSLGGSISFLVEAISHPGEDVRVLGALISDVVAWIRSLSGSISAFASRVGRGFSGDPARFVCTRTKSVKAGQGLS